MQVLFGECLFFVGSVSLPVSGPAPFHCAQTRVLCSSVASPAPLTGHVQELQMKKGLALAADYSLSFGGEWRVYRMVGGGVAGQPRKFTGQPQANK